MGVWSCEPAWHIHIVKGVQEVMRLMSVGDRFEIFVPSELAYGDSAPGEGVSLPRTQQVHSHVRSPPASHNIEQAVRARGHR